MTAAVSSELIWNSKYAYRCTAPERKVTMDYKAFCDYVCENIENYLTEYSFTREPMIKEVNKNNGVKLVGLLISTDIDKDICPNIYLDYYYQRYEDGAGMDQVLKEIADEYRSVSEQIKSMRSVIDDDSWNRDISRVIPKLVNYERNKEVLSDAPYIRLLDLAVSFRTVVNFDGTGLSSTLLTNDRFRDFGMGIDELFNKAMENYNVMFPPKIRNMAEMMFGEMGMDDDFGLMPKYYVVTNEKCINGATTLLDIATLDRLSKEIYDEGDYYILPSSIHESITIGCGSGMEVDGLVALVKEVNREVLRDTDFLSDSVYRYDSDSMSIVLCNP